MLYAQRSFAADRDGGYRAGRKHLPVVTLKRAA